MGHTQILGAANGSGVAFKSNTRSCAPLHAQQQPSFVVENPWLFIFVFLSLTCPALTTTASTSCSGSTPLLFQTVGRKHLEQGAGEDTMHRGTVSVTNQCRLRSSLTIHCVRHMQILVCSQHLLRPYTCSRQLCPCSVPWLSWPAAAAPTAACDWHLLPS